ncbi:unnamed protein product [Schistosoma rodhaini]|uniref:Sin3 histone deacetylase corepressor complex component SDS3 n=1 Tax=Schistosoma rodhaini TaxID=6188 RepID=A0AA85FXF0_9TREM|nr:unnamed protein product [Schistosoma rodhaini]CAH8575418.1 unnamed protein product [Schistosoma rodhaini]
MKRKHTEKSTYLSAPAMPTSVRGDLSDVSDDFEDTYNTEVANIQTQLDQLDNKTHPEFVKIRGEIETWYSEQKQRIHILHEHKLDTIYREYTKEAEACDRDCEHEKRRIQAYLVSLCEELKRRLEHDKKSIELTPSGDILEFKPAITRKLRRRAIGGIGSGVSVGSAGGNDVSASNPANFMYWGDLLLCGSHWPMNSNLSTRLQKSNSNDSYNSTVIANNNDENTDPIQSSSNLENEPKENDISGIPSSNTMSSVFKSTSLSSSLSTTSASTTTATASSTTTMTSATFNSTSKSNIFGTLGLNPFDGSLLSHLLASMNNNTSLTNFYTNSSYLSNTPDNINSVGDLLTNGGVAMNSSCNSTAVAVAAVAAGLIMPSNGTGTIGLSNNIRLSPVTALGCGLVPLLNNTNNNYNHSSSTSIRKRRHQNTAPSAQLNLLLPEHEIYADLTIIHRACSKVANNTNGTSMSSGSRKHSSHTASNNSNHTPNNTSNTSQLCCNSPLSPSLGKCYEDNCGSSRLTKDSNTSMNTPFSSHSIGSPNSFSSVSVGDSSLTRTGARTTGIGHIGTSSSMNNQSNTSLSIWIDDGRLYCGHKCYQIGASVILEGRDGSSHRCTGTIASIGVQDIAIRRCSDHGICRVTVQQLKQGRYAIWPNKSE